MAFPISGAYFATPPWVAQHHGRAHSLPQGAVPASRALQADLPQEPLALELREQTKAVRLKVAGKGVKIVAEKLLLAKM